MYFLNLEKLLFWGMSLICSVKFVCFFHLSIIDINYTDTIIDQRKVSQFVAYSFVGCVEFLTPCESDSVTTITKAFLGIGLHL